MVAIHWPDIDRIMTPGTNSMLRARRKDKELRPNRLLDRTASRGMLYENEELRLRTININADLEKGQQYIKKLRRENGQLRREIWSLRDQYDKLESMLKNQEQEQLSVDELNEYDEEGRDETDEPETLSIVEEENETEDERLDDKTVVQENLENYDKQTPEISPSDNVDEMTKQLLNLGAVIEVITSNVPTNNDVQEVIDNLEVQLKDDCRGIVKGVRLTDRNCFVNLNSAVQCETVLNSVLTLRDKPIKLDDVWIQSTILQLCAVPHYVIDEQIVAVISRFADVIGNIEKQTYKGLDTGERFVHVKTPDIIPYQLLLGSICIPVHIIYPKLDNRPNISRRKSFRSQININLKQPVGDAEENCANATSSESNPSVKESNTTKSLPSFFSKSTGITLTPPEVENNVFQFPPGNSPSTNQQTSKKKPNLATLSPNTAKDVSPSSFRKFTQRRVNSIRKPNAEGSQPPSPAPGQNSIKLARKLSVNFKNGPGEGLLRSRNTDGNSNEFGFGYMRERSLSDASSGRQSICRRKLSVTGHENSPKIPWCGCWGIGCC